MKKRPDNLIEALKESIYENHKCEAIYIQSVLVEEASQDKTLWSGQVELFEVRGHVKARMAFGWWQENAANGLVTILALTSTMDARKAVQAYLMSQDEP